MIAVIARGLGCEVCAPEVSEALRREGLKESTLAQVLTHLDAPELEPIERLLVPFARETIWYEPAPLQRRARMLRDRLSGPQLLEAIGVASLANGLCRMGATVMDQHMTGPSSSLLCWCSLAGLAVAIYRQWRQNQTLKAQLEAIATDLQHLQQSCSRLVPAGVVQHLIADGVKSGIETAAPERKVVTVLFADLVGSTAMSDRLEPAVLARVLNGYFQRMSDAIHEHRGHVAHFLGDGIVAYFGALQPNPWQCNDAVRAALAMRAAIREYNVELGREGLPLLALGIGIDRGLGLVGLVGSRERMEYDFVGRTVNVAARVQTLTRIHQADILVTEALRAELDARFVLMPMPAEMVKGIAEPVVTYAVREAIG